MCNFRKLLAGVVLICITTSSLAEGDAGYYGYGKSATATEIAGWDIDIRADGQGLPPGSGSVEDGEVIYEADVVTLLDVPEAGLISRLGDFIFLLFESMFGND